MIVSSRPFSRAISRLQRSSHLAVRSTEACTYPLSALLGAHSSKAMAMVEARLDWMRMLSSGPMKIFLPSTWELKYTPSSLILRSPARENT